MQNWGRSWYKDDDDDDIDQSDQHPGVVGTTSIVCSSGARFNIDKKIICDIFSAPAFKFRDSV